MGKLYRTFTTLWTLLSFSALLGGVVLWKAGYLRIPVGLPEAQATGEPQKAPPPPAAPSAGVSPPAPQASLSNEEIRPWVLRLERLRREVDWKEAEVLSDLAVLREREKRLAALARSFAELAVVLLPQEGPLSEEELLTDPQKVRALGEKLNAAAAQRRRMPEVIATIAHMQEEAAAELLSEGLDSELACRVLQALDTESRASLLGLVARKNPAKAAQLFKKLAEAAESEGG